jgi:hypothetical protein
MEYTKIDAIEVADEIVLAKYKNSVNESANFDLDKARVVFCQEVREIAGDDEDVELSQLATQLDEQRVSKEAEVIRLESKISEVPSLISDRKEWLEQYITQVEREHAAHAALIDLSEEIGDTDQIKSSTIAQIVCEGAHKAATAELNDEPVKVKKDVPKDGNEKGRIA